MELNLNIQYCFPSVPLFKFSHVSFSSNSLSSHAFACVSGIQLTHKKEKWRKYSIPLLNKNVVMGILKFISSWIMSIAALPFSFVGFFFFFFFFILIIVPCRHFSIWFNYKYIFLLETTRLPSLHGYTFFYCFCRSNNPSISESYIQKLIPSVWKPCNTPMSAIHALEYIISGRMCIFS